MNIEKRCLATMAGCYAANSLAVDGQTRILLATESAGPCRAWLGPDYHSAHTVWDGPGGTMSMVPIPGSNGEFLAVQQFFRMYACEEAKLVHVRPLGAGGYAVSTILQLPYLHRFDLLTVADRHYFIGCTLANSKATQDDWSDPGKIWVGEFTQTGTGPDPLQLSELKGGLRKNHGYSRLHENGITYGLVGSDEGTFKIRPPQSPGEAWAVTQFMDWPVSDIAAIDIDGDGELEFATIEPFHGAYFRIYKKINGVLTKIFEHPEVTEFYHVVVAATLTGKPVFIGGCRRGKQQLFYVHAQQHNPLKLQTVIIDAGVGPSNVHVVNETARDIIVAANREKGEAALYVVS